MNVSHETILRDLKIRLDKEYPLDQAQETHSVSCDANDIALCGIAEVLHYLLRQRMLLLSSFNVTGIEDAANTSLIKIAEQPCRASDLAKMTLSDPSTIARQIKHLLDEKLVIKVPDKRDGRATILFATPLGEKRAKKIMELRKDYYADVFHDWSVHDKQQFIDYLFRFAGDTDRVIKDFFT